MSFNLKKAIAERNKPEKEAIRLFRKTKEEKAEEKVQVKKEVSLFIIYVMKNYVFSTKANKQDFNIRVWSKLDQRYVFNTYTNDTEKVLIYITKQFKKKDSMVVDIREVTERELIEKYRMRFL